MEKSSVIMTEQDMQSYQNGQAYIAAVARNHGARYAAEHSLRCHLHHDAARAFFVGCLDGAISIALDAKASGRL